MVVCEPCRHGDHLRCTSQGWGGCRCSSCYLLAPGTAATPSVAPGDGEAASPRDTTAVPGPTASDFPDCRACQMWEDAGASWPRPCKQHYGGESPQAVTYQEALLEGADPYEPDYDPR